jgi:hypothetical protein
MVRPLDQHRCNILPDQTLAGLPQGLFDAACEGMRPHEIGAAPRVHPARARRIAVNIAKLPDLVRRPTSWETP